MKTTTSFATLMVALGFRVAFATPTAASGPGWTHDEYLEYLTLNDTTDWSGLSKLTYVNMADLPTEPSVLSKRSGGNQFIGWELDKCQDQSRFSDDNFGSGVCVTGSSPAYAGQLTRQKSGGVYPTADWYAGQYCSGKKLHHHGITGSNGCSCDTASAYGVTNFYSAVLYQGC
nr:hypothetical protein B0A51_05064 [Rachicladosporium sp. CCFEE 5018]